VRILLFSNIRGPDAYLPLNLLSLASYARALGHDVTVVDGQTEPDWLPRCMAAANDADLVGVSSYTGPSINAILTLLREMRAQGISRPVAWGGYHGTLAHRKILQEGWASFVVRGYGEHALRGILRHLEFGEPIADVVNVSHLDAAGQVVENPRTKIDFLDELPPLDYDFVDVDAYFTADRRIVQYISSYGCPYACTFCAEPAHSGRRWRGFPVARVVADLQRIMQRYQPERVSFVDPNMSSQPARVAELAVELVAAGSPVGINCNMRSRDVLEIAKLVPISVLRQAGFRRVFIGVESGDDGQLKTLKKSATASGHEQAITLLDEAGIEVQMSFIHDLPGETREQAEATLDLAKSLLKVRTPHSNQSHHFYMPYPGTELAAAAGGEEHPFDEVSQDAWARTSTFKANAVWRGNAERRSWVIAELDKLHARNPAVLPEKEIARLHEEGRIEDDYVERFML